MFNNIDDVVKVFRENGVKIKSQTGDYAILGSMSSVIFRTQSNGSNGIIICCYRDKEDLNRIVGKLNKEYEPNGEATRPYKVAISDAEVNEVINILKMNTKNLLL